MIRYEKPAECKLNGPSGADRLPADRPEGTRIGEDEQRWPSGLRGHSIHSLSLRTLQNDDGHFVGLEVVR